MKELAFFLTTHLKTRSWAILLTLLVWMLAVSAVSAHALLVKSEPEDGAELDRSPRQVTAWFSQELDTGFSTMQVFNAAGQQVDAGDGGVDLFDPDHATLVVNLPQELPGGGYTVRWAVVSVEDGDPTQGEFTFAVGHATAAPSGSLAGAGLLPVGWLVAGGGGLVVLAAAGWFLQARRAKKP